jgi:hypothetical protein
MQLALLKEGGPQAGDVHVNGVAEPGKRTRQDIEDERLAALRTGAGGVDKAFGTFFKVSGVDEDLGLVYGWGIVCKENGVDYYDSQDNHIPEGAMVYAVTDFMKSERVHGEQHSRGVTAGDPAGMVVHSFPLTTEIAKQMGITTGKTGWMVATAPDKAMLAKFKSGELTGFSIGGRHIELDGQTIQ